MERVIVRGMVRLGISRRVACVFGIFAALCCAGAVARAQSTVEQQCTPDMMKQDPELCGHARMLKEGDNLYTVYHLHAARKVEKVEQAFGDTFPEAEFTKFKTDGTCLEADLDATKIYTVDAGKRCVARLRRQAADAELQARRAILDQNRGRTELLTQKGAKNAKDLVGASLPPSQVSDGKYDRVTKDLNEGLKPVTPGKNDVYRMLAVPQAVNFTGKATTGDGFDGDVDKVKHVDTKDINADAPVALNPESQEFDRSGADGDDPKALSAAYASTHKRIQKSLNDDRKIYQQVKPTQYDAKKNGNASVSAEALNEIMNGYTDSQGNVIEGLNAKAGKKLGVPAGKPATDAANSVDLYEDVTNKPANTKGSTLDESLTNHLGNLQ